MIRAIAALLGGGLADQLRRAYEARLAAGNDADRLAAETEIARLHARLARSDNPLLQLAIGIVALSLSLHLALVAFVSAVPQWGWTVHALPAPMNDWQGRIILGFFGLQALARIVRR